MSQLLGTEVTGKNVTGTIKIFKKVNNLKKRVVTPTFYVAKWKWQANRHLITVESALYKRPCIKQSPSIKRSPVKVPKITSLNYCNFDLYLVVTPIKRSRSPFTKSQ